MTGTIFRPNPNCYHINANPNTNPNPINTKTNLNAIRPNNPNYNHTPRMENR